MLFILLIKNFKTFIRVIKRDTYWEHCGAAKYFGSGEVVTSGFYLNGADPLGYDGKVIGLDKYAYNLAEGMISGPLLLKKDSLGNKTEVPILGFFLSANVTDQLDGRPLHNGGGYRIKKDVRDDYWIMKMDLDHWDQIVKVPVHIIIQAF